MTLNAVAGVVFGALVSGVTVAGERQHRTTRMSIARSVRAVFGVYFSLPARQMSHEGVTEEDRSSGTLWHTRLFVEQHG